MTLALAHTNGSNGHNVELAIAAWLDAKKGKSGSEKTHTAYAQTLASYRTALSQVGLDLDSTDARALALVAQDWAGHSAKEGKKVSASTYNQRLAIVSSFFDYAAKRDLIPDGNPIASYCERRRVDGYGHSAAVNADTIAKGMGAIDTNTVHGLRDWTLLAIALTTGRRLSEVTGLRLGDIVNDGTSVTLVFKCKGNKVMRDTLQPAIATALVSYLAQTETDRTDDSVWLSHSRQNKGKGIGIQAVADIAERRLGTSKFHSLRHSFASEMEKAGASVSDIQKRLGHESLATTGRYLAKLASATNAHGNALLVAFGL